MSFWDHKRRVIQNSDYLSSAEKEHAVELTHVFENLLPHPNSLYFTTKNELVLLWRLGNQGNPTLLEISFGPGKYEGNVRVIKAEIKEEE